MSWLFGKRSDASTSMLPTKKASEGTPLVQEGGIVHAGALDDGGELPLFTCRTCGVLLCMCLSWVQRGATASMPVSIMTNYLHAPANLIAAFPAVVPSPGMFVLIPGLLSDCVPVCGSRRKFYCFVGASLVFVGYFLLAVLPFPAPYYCQDDADAADATQQHQHASGHQMGGMGRRLAHTMAHDGEPAMAAQAGGSAGRAPPPRAVCNPDAALSSGNIVALLTLAQVGATILDASLAGLVLDYARREPLATRGRTFSLNAVGCLLGSATGSVFAGLSLSTPEYGGYFSFGLGLQGVAWVFCGLQLVIMGLLAMCTYEPPLPAGLSDGRLAAAMHSLRQTADMLRNSFLVRVLAFHLLAEWMNNVLLPAEMPAVTYWCHVTPFAYSLMVFCACVFFAAFTALLIKRLPNWSWRTFVLSATLIFGLGGALSHSLITINVIRTPLFVFFTGGAEIIVTMARQLVANFVITELTSGANQATLGALFGTVHAMGSPLGRAIAEPLFGALPGPSMSETQNYLDDTDEFRHVVLVACLVVAGFSCTIIFFIHLLPDSKAEAQEGKRNAVKRDSYLYTIVIGVAVLIVFGLLMVVAPFVPALSCVHFFGGAGCHD